MTTERQDHLRTPAGLASELRPSVMRLARRLRQVQDERDGLNPNQLSALAVLFNAGDLPIGELAALERVQPPSMTRIVNGLEERGLVGRTPDPTDRRSSRVSLSADGRRVVLANRRRRDEWLAVRIAQLDSAERDLLRACVPLLEKLHA